MRAFDVIGNESSSGSLAVSLPDTPPHPRLFFSAAELPDLQAKAATSHADIVAQVIRLADDALTVAPIAYPGQSGEYSTCWKDMLALAFAYVVSGEAAYGADDSFRNYIQWALFNYLPGSAQPVMPFSNYVPGWGGWAVAGSFAYPRAFAGRYGVGVGEWVTEQLPRTVHRGTYHAQAYVFEFFYYDEALAPVAPAEQTPLRRTFSDLGATIWRTRWGDEERVAKDRRGDAGHAAGPSAGHAAHHGIEEQDRGSHRGDVRGGGLGTDETNRGGGF